MNSGKKSGNPERIPEISLFSAQIFDCFVERYFSLNFYFQLLVLHYNILEKFDNYH